MQELEKLRISCRALPRMAARNTAASVRRLVRELRAADVDVFHAHLNWPLACRHGIMAARLAGIRGVVATVHLYSPIAGVRFGRLKQRLQAGALHRYIAVSNEVKNRLCEDLRVAEAKVRVVHNGVRLPPLEPPVDGSLRSQLMGSTERSIVFTPARLHTQKGHRYLLQAAAQIREAVFVLAGEGPERSSLESQAQSLGIQDRVRFLGQREDIPRLLASCDLFVLPSLIEGLPLSVLEAMAAGKPVIATDIGGTNEVVVQGETGLLVPPARPAELAAAIRGLLMDKSLADHLGAAGRQRARQMFSFDAMVQGVTEVYKELI